MKTTQTQIILCAPGILQNLRYVNEWTLLKFRTNMELNCPNKRVKMVFKKERHDENMPIQIYWKFYDQKLKIFR